GAAPPRATPPGPRPYGRDGPAPGPAGRARRPARAPRRGSRATHVRRRPGGPSAAAGGPVPATRPLSPFALDPGHQLVPRARLVRVHHVVAGGRHPLAHGRGPHLLGGGEQVAGGQRDRTPRLDRLLELGLDRPVHHALQVGADELVGRLGHRAEVHLGQRLVAAEDAQDRRARLGVRRRHEDELVEPARTAEGHVDVPGRVRRGEHQHALVGALVDAVQLGHALADDLPVGRMSERRAASASTSSKNSTHGRWRRARSKTARRFRSLEPMYMSRMSARLTFTNAAPSSPAAALARCVLPTPGGPYSRTPPPARLPKAANSSGCWIGSSSLTRRDSLTSSMPATSAKVTAARSTSALESSCVTA